MDARGMHAGWTHTYTHGDAKVWGCVTRFDDAVNHRAAAAAGRPRPNQQHPYAARAISNRERSCPWFIVPWRVVYNAVVWKRWSTFRESNEDAWKKYIYIRRSCVCGWLGVVQRIRSSSRAGQGRIMGLKSTDNPREGQLISARR